METSQKFGHIMIDIETMGNESSVAIVSIGAVEFNMNTGETGKEFYTNVSLQSCLDIGLKINASTLMWWMKQSDEARKTLTDGSPLHIKEALLKFSEFVNECGGKTAQVWGNSARFDLGILSDAYSKASFIGIPWDFRNERCVRTLVSFLPEIKNMTKFQGTAHNAIDDCHFQIKYCSETWNALTAIRQNG